MGRAAILRLAAASGAARGAVPGHRIRAAAIVVFAGWKPWRCLPGAWLFGGITVLQLNLQAAGTWLPVQYLSMSPYLITILVLVLMSADRSRAALNAPADLGRNFQASR